MIKEVEKLTATHEIIVQAGHSKFKSNKMEIFDFISSEMLNILYQKADYIITHAGAGSMFHAIKLAKKTIVFPRLRKYGEHVNDHQLQLAEKLQNMGYLLVFYDGDDIVNKFNEVRAFMPAPYNLKGDIVALIDNSINASI